MMLPIKTIQVIRVCLLFFIFSYSYSAFSDSSSKKLVREAKSQFRKVDSHMGNGNYSESKVILMKIAATINQLEKTDPSNSKVESFKRKVNSSAKVIARETGEKLNLWGPDNQTATTLSTKTISPTPIKKSTSSTTLIKNKRTKKLPYATRQKMGEVKNQLKKIDENYNHLSNYTALDHRSIKILDDISSQLKKLKPLLNEVKKVAAKDGVANHSEFDSVQKEIAEQHEKYTLKRKNTLAQKEKGLSNLSVIKTDIAKLKLAYNRLDKAYFQKAKGVAIYANDLPPLLALIETIEYFEKNEKSKAISIVKSFAEKYKDRKEEVTKVDKQSNKQTLNIIVRDSI